MQQYDLRNGDILLYRGTDKFGKLIKWFTFSEFSHVAILTDSGRAKTVSEALSKGFRTADYGTELDDFIEKGIISVYRYQNLGSKKFGEIKAYCERSNGLPYDWGDITKIVTNKLTLGLTFNDSSRQLICSEAVQRAFLCAGIKLVDKPADYVTPKDISKCKLLVKIY